MTERERIVKELENYEPYAVHFPHLTIDGKLMLDVLKFLREQPQWISVKDRLPENNAVYLTYSPKGRMRVAQAFLPSSIPNSKYDPMECWWSIHGDRSRFVAVTHWMPLPEPPRDEEVKQDG